MANQQFQGTEGNRYATQPHQQNAYHRLPKNQFSFIINEAHLNNDIRKTRMWADAQRDGGPAEYRWRLCVSSVIPVLVPYCKVWQMPAAGVLCSNAANIRQCKIWTQSEFCTWQNSVRGQKPPKMYI